MFNHLHRHYPTRSDIVFTKPVSAIEALRRDGLLVARNTHGDHTWLAHSTALLGSAAFSGVLEDADETTLAEFAERLVGGVDSELVLAQIEGALDPVAGIMLDAVPDTLISTLYEDVGGMKHAIPTGHHRGRPHVAYADLEPVRNRIRLLGGALGVRVIGALTQD